MARMKLWVGLILLFGLGALAGSLGTGLYYKNRIERLGRYDPSTKFHFLIKRLSQELNLTEEQKKKMTIVLDQFYSSLSDLKQSMYPEIENLRDRTYVSIKELLNDHQGKKFDELWKRLAQWSPEDRLKALLSKITPESMISEMKNRLRLTDEQESKVRPIIEDSIKEQRRILDKYSNQNRRDDRSFRQELKEHRISTEEKLSKVLSAEQLVQFRRLEDEQRNRPSLSH